MIYFRKKEPERINSLLPVANVAIDKQLITSRLVVPNAGGSQGGNFIFKGRNSIFVIKPFIFVFFGKAMWYTKNILKIIKLQTCITERNG